MQDLLSFIQNHARDKRENLAGEVLALLLREEAGQRVLRSLIASFTSSVHFIEVETQKVTLGCIPDIHLIQQGYTIALLELKFSAPLTRDQLSGKYFDVAPHVVFIVPKKRVEQIMAELAGLVSKHSLQVLSWEDLLLQLENEAGDGNTRDELLFRGALEHLKEFCNLIEQEHFIPFTSEELSSPIRDITTRHLVWLTREVIASATQEQVIREAGKLGAGYDSFFFYGQMVVLGRFRVWLGYWPYAWRKSPSDGPLWVQFNGQDAKILRRAGTFGDGLPVMGNDLAFPIFSPVGSYASQHEEVLGVTEALTHLTERLPFTTAETQNGASRCASSADATAAHS